MLRPSSALAGAATVLLCACSRQTNVPVTEGTLFADHASRTHTTKVFQPLAVGDYWKYVCNHEFNIEDRVVGKYALDKRTVFALSLQIPSSPSKSTKVVQLLANDVHGNDWIYGYLINGKVRAVKATEIVAESPVLDKHYDYPAPKGGTISRVFKGFEYTNRTPLGVFRVAPYFDGGGTHNYGYSLGRGVMEEDHGPRYKYDCLIEKYVLH
jgi:hypothetical protein